ncbi:MAG TPA: radical SAM protein [Smithellaceae bacterium]|nr:radical SAM protein [Smithellaceae bacterium]HRS88350.1 radical SAM protein [Smithellaceae bacterium]HRV24995.1 radical SAM protein [Smithellaceae bacterium]
MASCLNSIYFYNKNCNLRCRHCWIEPDYEKSNDADLKLHEVKELFLQGKELGMSGVKLTGGEPLMLPYILLLIRFLRDEKISIVLETNGTLINEEIAEVLSQAQAFVSVSLDGTSEKIHNLLRVSAGSFTRAIQGIKYLTDKGIAPQIIFSLHKQNASDLPAMIGYAKKLGARSLKINLIRGIGRAKDIEGENNLVSAQEFLDLYRIHKDKSDDDFKVLFDIPSAFKTISDINQDRCNTCGVKGIIGVLSDGTVSICGIGNIMNELCFGNIRKRPLADIWQNTPLLRFIREDIPQKLEGICGRCLLKGMCLGKCIANTYYATGCLTGGNLFCEEAYKAGIFPENRLL